MNQHRMKKKQHTQYDRILNMRENIQMEMTRKIQKSVKVVISKY